MCCDGRHKGQNISDSGDAATTHGIFETSMLGRETESDADEGAIANRIMLSDSSNGREMLQKNRSKY